MKPLDEFHRDRTSRDGRGRRCKPCACARSREWVRENPEQATATRRRYERVHRDRLNQKARERYKADPSRDLNAKLKYRYGVDGERFEAMVMAQHGLCAICGQPPGRSRLHVDHDHVTGAVRGLLCGPCNHGLGFFRDNPTVLRRAIRYLVGAR